MNANGACSQCGENRWRWHFWTWICIGCAHEEQSQFHPPVRAVAHRSTGDVIGHTTTTDGNW